MNLLSLTENGESEAKKQKVEDFSDSFCDQLSSSVEGNENYKESIGIVKESLKSPGENEVKVSSEWPD